VYRRYPALSADPHTSPSPSAAIIRTDNKCARTVLLEGRSIARGTIVHLPSLCCRNRRVSRWRLMRCPFENARQRVLTMTWIEKIIKQSSAKNRRRVTRWQVPNYRSHDVRLSHVWKLSNLTSSGLIASRKSLLWQREREIFYTCINSLWYRFG